MILTLVGIVGSFGIGCRLGQCRAYVVLDVIDACRDQSQTYDEAAGSQCRIEIPETSPGVTLGGFSGVGYVGIRDHAG